MPAQVRRRDRVRSIRTVVGPGAPDQLTCRSSSSRVARPKRIYAAIPATKVGGTDCLHSLLPLGDANKAAAFTPP